MEVPQVHIQEACRCRGGLFRPPMDIYVEEMAPPFGGPPQKGSLAWSFEDVPKGGRSHRFERRYFCQTCFLFGLCFCFLAFKQEVFKTENTHLVCPGSNQTCPSSSLCPAPNRIGEVVRTVPRLEVQEIIREVPKVEAGAAPSAGLILRSSRGATTHNRVDGFICQEGARGGGGVMCVSVCVCATWRIASCVKEGGGGGVVCVCVNRIWIPHIWMLVLKLHIGLPVRPHRA